MGCINYIVTFKLLIVCLQEQLVNGRFMEKSHKYHRKSKHFGLKFVFIFFLLNSVFHLNCLAQYTDTLYGTVTNIGYADNPSYDDLITVNDGSSIRIEVFETPTVCSMQAFLEIKFLNVSLTSKFLKCTGSGTTIRASDGDQELIIKDLIFLLSMDGVNYYGKLTSHAND